MIALNVITLIVGDIIKRMIKIQNIIIAQKIRFYMNNRLTAQSYVPILCTILSLLLTILLPSHLSAKEYDFYTVQTGSFTTKKIAAKQFNSLSIGLDERERAHLRIEKIGNYYAVRVGKFNDRISADKFIQARAAKFTGAIILKSWFHEKRIIKLYSEITEPKVDKDTEKLMLATEALKAAMDQVGQDNESAGNTVTTAIKDQSDNKEVAENKAGSRQASLKNESAKKTKKYSDIKGRFYVSDYYSNDSNNFDFHVLSARLKVYMRESDDSRYYFKLDARARKKVSDNDVHNGIPEYKFYEAWLGYKFAEQKIDLIAGRQNVQEMYNTNVDGINAKYRFRDDLGIGIFGGLAPDKYDYSFNTKFKTAGIYSFLDRDRYKLRFGYERLYYDGKTDREYISFKLFSDFNKKIWFNLLSSASINQLTNKIDIDNLSTNMLYKYSRDLRFNVFFNYYRAIRYFESSKKFFTLNNGGDSYYLDTNSQSRIGFRVNYRLQKKLTIYASMAYQQREIDNESATRFTGGIRKYDLYGFNLSGRYTRINNFTSKSNEFNVEVSRLLLQKMDVSVYASHEQEELEIENGFTAGLLTYGASVYWSINKHYFASMFLERYDEDDYDNTSIFTQAGYRF